MNIRQILSAAATVVFCLAATTRLHAQAFGAVSSVSGTGAEVIRRPPEILRMQIEISAKGKTLADALKKLAAHREAALAQLAKMSSEKETTKAGEARIDSVTSSRQRQIEMMVRQRMGQAGKKSKKAPEKPISVNCELTAEWKLKGKTSESLLLEAQAIEDKVQAADLAGKNSEEKTPEEEELAEEMEDGGMMYDDGSQPKPGEPLFMFVSKVTPQDRAQAMAAAFAKARQQAEELSKAAGAELGDLQGLSGQASLSSFSFGTNSPYGNLRNQQFMQLMSERAERGDDEAAEAIGVQPSEVVLPINVTASFQLKPAK